MHYLDMGHFWRETHPGRPILLRHAPSQWTAESLPILTFGYHQTATARPKHQTFARHTISILFSHLKKFIPSLQKTLSIRKQLDALTLYFPSPTWKTRNFCLQVHNMTSRFTSSWILSASVTGFFSSQSGRSAAMNSFQSMKPSLLWSNMSATAFISILLVSNPTNKQNRFVVIYFPR